MNKSDPELNKLDVSMSVLYSRLMLLEQDSLEYKKTLELLAKQYQEFNSKQKESIYQYFIMYSNMKEIREILENAGYIEQKSKTK